MTPELKAALAAYVVSQGYDDDGVYYVDLSDNGCGESPTLDISYRNDGRSNYIELGPGEIEDFLEFLVKGPESE